MTEVSRAELLKAERLLKEIERRKNECKLDFFDPYPKQEELYAMGFKKRERLLMAGNQCGKTYCGAAEVAMHLTGRYPEWWLGRRWDRPTRWWVAGVTGESTRDTCQKYLLGSVEEVFEYGPGRGMIPKHCLDRDRMMTSRSAPNLFDTVPVRHVSGSWSRLVFKSYERGREKWQGETLDGVWYDEEPEMDIYQEGLARISATSGMVFITFTPLKGKSKVVLRYLEEPSPYRGVVTMTIDDATHMTPDKKAEILSGYLPHEMEARTKGIPSLGSGKIFTTLEENILEPPFPLPNHWRYIWGIDFGIDHPFAAVLLGIDMDKDVIHVMHSYRASNEMPIQHCAAMRPACAGRGDKVPIAWPQDGTQRKEFEGELIETAMIYKRHKMNVLSSHATFPDGSNSTWAGILEMRERFASGRLKVFNSQSQWLDEYREYHMDEGKIKKVRDDLMSATRVGIMAKRFAKSILFTPNSQDGRRPSETGMAKDIDFQYDW